MAYICYKPKGSCEACPHYRFDEDKQRNGCWAVYDQRHGKEAERKEEAKA